MNRKSEGLYKNKKEIQDIAYFWTKIVFWRASKKCALFQIYIANQFHLIELFYRKQTFEIGTLLSRVAITIIA